MGAVGRKELVGRLKLSGVGVNGVRGDQALPMAIETMEVQGEASVRGSRGGGVMVCEVRVVEAQGGLPALRLRGGDEAFWIFTLLHLSAEVHDLLVRRIRRRVSLQHLHVNLLLTLLFKLLLHLLFGPVLEKRLLR